MQPDTNLVLMQDQTTIAARCSLWWQNPPDYADHQPGLIGHYVAQDSVAARSLLNSACDQLAAQGCTIAIAPIDGNTWQSYRFMIDRGTEPPFFLEPDHPPEYPQQFLQAGFAPLAYYSSALVVDLMQKNPRLQPVAQRLSKLGVSIRSIDSTQFNTEFDTGFDTEFDTELERIYQLSRISFRQNFLYTPLAAAEFIAQYHPIKPYLDPRLVLVAEHQQRLVGFLFAIPNLEQAKRGEAIDTVIIKTVAILPERPYAGLGSILVEQIQTIAHQLGYRRAIHALMHEDNKSRNLSDRYAKPIRRYALFSKLL
jgi:GNAT superfamily N-acetyltransferase